MVRFLRFPASCVRDEPGLTEGAELLAAQTHRHCLAIAALAPAPEVRRIAAAVLACLCQSGPSTSFSSLSPLSCYWCFWSCLTLDTERGMAMLRTPDSVLALLRAVQRGGSPASGAIRTIARLCSTPGTLILPLSVDPIHFSCLFLPRVVGLTVSLQPRCRLQRSLFAAAVHGHCMPWHRIAHVPKRRVTPLPCSSWCQACLVRGSSLSISICPSSRLPVSCL
jgi:hypothetical protein